MGIVDVKSKRTVTADFSQLWCQQNRKEIAELSTIGRNHRLTELTFKLLSEKSKMPHSSENVRSLKNKKERQGHFDSLIGKSRLGQIGGVSFLFFSRPIRLRAGFGPEELESTWGRLAVSTFCTQLNAIFNMFPSVGP